MVVCSSSVLGPCGGGLSQPAKTIIITPNAIASSFMERLPEKLGGVCSEWSANTAKYEKCETHGNPAPAATENPVVSCRPAQQEGLLIHQNVLIIAVERELRLHDRPVSVRVWQIEETGFIHAHGSATDDFSRTFDNSVG